MYNRSSRYNFIDFPLEKNKITRTDVRLVIIRVAAGYIFLINTFRIVLINCK